MGEKTSKVAEKFASYMSDNPRECGILELLVVELRKACLTVSAFL